MCWNCYHKYLSTLKTAKEDIKVFKIVEIHGKRIGPYFNYFNNVFYGTVNEDGTYSINQDMLKNELKKFKVCSNCWKSEIAFHSYSLEQLKEYVSIKTHYSWCNDFVICIPFYYWSIAYPLSSGVLLMDCIIPKGAKYAINEHGEVISDTLKVVGFCSGEEFVYRDKKEQ